MVDKTRAIIIGSGPTVNYGKAIDFDGIHIACDKEYHKLIHAGVHVDYIITLEDNDLSKYFKPPHQDPKPIVVISLRTAENTRNTIGEQDFDIKVFGYKLLQETFNVGMMAWLFTWMKLDCKEIHLTGFDHLYPKSGYSMLHHLWRDMFRECLDDLVPKDVKTIIPDMQNYKIQIRKDNLDLHDQKKEYIGTKNLDDYIRYRGRRNNLFIRQMQEWDQYV